MLAAARTAVFFLGSQELEPGHRPTSFRLIQQFRNCSMIAGSAARDIYTSSEAPPNMKLSEIFEAVASKRLVVCDLPKRRSNQHELTGVATLKSVLGVASKTQGRLTWVLFKTRVAEAQEDNAYTFYDARAKSATRTRRSEWRFYYYGNFLVQAEVGDLLILSKTRTHGLLGMIFAKNSAAYAEIVMLFSLPVAASFDTVPTEYLEGHDWKVKETPILHNWFKSKLAA